MNALFKYLNPQNMYVKIKIYVEKYLNFILNDILTDVKYVKTK